MTTVGPGWVGLSEKCADSVNLLGTLSLKQTSGLGMVNGLSPRTDNDSAYRGLEGCGELFSSSTSLLFIFPVALP